MKRVVFKRILCALVSFAVLVSTGSVSAQAEKNENASGEIVTVFTPPEIKKDESLRYDPEAEYPVYSGYTPDYYSRYDSYNYGMFLELLKVYKETHLYEFTEDEALEAFLMKLIDENPLSMKMFMDTLLGTMDEYSAYYEAGEGLASDGSAKAYGIVYGDETSTSADSLGITEPGVYITEVVKGSNAEAAGLMAGDKVVSVQGIGTEGLTLDAVSYLVKYQPYVGKEEFDENGVSTGIPNEPEYIINGETGKKEYPIVMEVERNGEIITAKLLKGNVIYSNISYWRNKEERYSYIGIASFTGDSDVKDFANALEKAKKESGGNLIIDLRDNAGGVVDNAVEIANMMIEEEGRILYYINSRQHEKPEPVYSTGGGYTFDRVTVLVNEYTASASELLAVMLRYNCAATIVGVNTYGKGVGQQAYTFPNGDMFTITSIEILDPLKRSYHKIGVAPDIEIDLCLTKEEFPESMNDFGVNDLIGLGEGAESIAVLGLEQRLALCGFMRSEYVDGKFDSVTTCAVKAFNLYTYQGPDGTFDEDDVRYLESMTDRHRNHYYLFDSQLEVAEMTFRSRSQAKRRVKELLTAEKKVKEEHDAYLKAEEEKLREEERAEQEAENTAAESGKETEGDTPKNTEK